MALSVIIDQDIQRVMDQVFCNELILDAIFKGLNVAYVRHKCRLVNSKWNRVAVKEIQRKHWNTGRFCLLRSRSRFESYLNLLRNAPENVLWWRYKIHFPLEESKSLPTRPVYPYSTTDRNLDYKLIKEFGETFKKQIKGVDIHRNCVSFCVQRILNLLQGESLKEIGISGVTIHMNPSCETNINRIECPLQITSSTMKLMFPNLKSLSLSGITRVSTEIILEDELFKCNQILKNILSQMRPNSLEVLNYHNWGRFDLAVENLVEFNQFESLRQLSLYPNTNFMKGDLLIFKKKGINIRLKELRIHNISPSTSCLEKSTTFHETDPVELYQFLLTQKNSLENLNLICSIYSFPSNMLGIKTLRIRIIGKGLAVNTLNVNFAESFPNLKHLYLWNIRYTSDPFERLGNKNHQVLSEQEPCSTLQTLTLSETLTLSFEPISRILKIFPRISSLELKVFSCEVFQHIWNTDGFSDTLNVLILWIPKPYARSSDVKYILQLDTAFSGICHEDILSVAPEKYTERFNLDEFQPNSILKLKNLRTLRLGILETRQHPFDIEVHPFTEFSALCVFNKMNLEHLSIDRGMTRFSRTCPLRFKENNGGGDYIWRDTWRSFTYLPWDMSRKEMHLNLC